MLRVMGHNPITGEIRSRYDGAYARRGPPKLVIGRVFRVFLRQTLYLLGEFRPFTHRYGATVRRCHARSYCSCRAHRPAILFAISLTGMVRRERGRRRDCRATSVNGYRTVDERYVPLFQVEARRSRR